MAKFLDIDINFDKNPVTKDVAVRKDEEAVKRALRNLVLYGRNDKPFHPEISAGIVDLLFANPDPLTMRDIKNKLQYIIEKYEPRVKTANINVVHVIDSGTLRITIEFTIANSNRLLTTTVNLERLR